MRHLGDGATLDPPTSPLLVSAGFRHAFFDRRGGVSGGAYESLSFSHTVGDDPVHVAENFRRAAAFLEVEPDRLLYLSQVHGSQVHEVPVAVPAPERVLGWEGDALWSRVPGVACCVRVADCVPVLLGSLSTGIAAAAHAGWRGVVRGVLRETVSAVTDAAGTGPDDVVAAIGPHISVAAFEVGEDVAEQLVAASGAQDVLRPGPRGRPHVDLRRIVTEQLLECGLPPQHVDQVPGCTVGEPARFFSYRRDGKRSGRHLAGIVPRRPR